MQQQSAVVGLDSRICSLVLGEALGRRLGGSWEIGVQQQSAVTTFIGRLLGGSWEIGVQQQSAVITFITITFAISLMGVLENAAFLVYGRIDSTAPAGCPLARLPTHLPCAGARDLAPWQVP